MSRTPTVILLFGAITLTLGCARNEPSAAYPTTAYAAPPPGLVGRIGPDDVLEITVLEAPELSRTARVSAQGSISMPLIGVISAHNKTPQQLEQVIAGKLRGKYMVDPQVSVELKEMRARSIFVLGAVKQPGSFPITGSEQLTVLRALALGAGLTGTASKGGARIIRHDAAGRRSEIPVDLGRVMAGQAPDVALQANDILLVPNSSGKSVASGMVNAVIRMVTLRGIF